MSRSMIQFYIDSSEGRIAPSSAALYRDQLERVFDDLEKTYGVRMEDEKIVGLDAKTLQSWCNALKKRVKPATVNGYVIALNGFLRWAATMNSEKDGEIIPYTKRDFSGVLHTLPLPDIDDLPPEERPKDKYYTEEQVHELMWGRHGKNQVRDRAIMGLIFFAGLRVSEVCSLTVGQFKEAANGTITVKRKGGKWCEVQVAEQAYKLVNAYLATRKDLDNPKAPLFITTHGTPCTRHSIYEALATKQKEVNVATGPHALRHTAISEMGNRFGAAMARDFANHKSFTVTNRYSHTTAAQMKHAVNELPWK